ncbi:hypothetical protein [Rhodohalobacter sp.]|uniref:hypothetical protein n=1 Tax=Rhodohalobacter sp. TaxID=1974210 RepID=UPI002ACE30FE|nr:hypothetical protein [Rhodohalobacter sp.]MDZ7754853.1 hypothetical protein [Rhodohalobacter sp.]
MVKFTLQTSDDLIEISVSYLHNSLRELTEAALKLSKGIKQVEVSFVDEPGEHRLVIKIEKDDKLMADVQWYKNWPTKKQNRYKTIIQISYYD